MRLIDADALREELDSILNWNTNNEYNMCSDTMVVIDNAPTIEAEPVRHGRWIEKETSIQCSNCGKEYNDEIRCMCYGEDAELNHCPKCGATMNEKE